MTAEPTANEKLVKKFNSLFPSGSKIWWRPTVESEYEELTVHSPARINGAGSACVLTHEKGAFLPITPDLLNYDVVTSTSDKRLETARKELELAGYFSPDSDYGGMVGNAVMELMGVLAGQGHSGASIALTLYLFNMLAMHKPLTPLTSDPDEWIDRSEETGSPLWQSRRCPSVFSKDGGKTWDDVEPIEEEKGYDPTKTYPQRADLAKRAKRRGRR